MMRILLFALILALSVASIGCLVSGQVTVVESIEIGATTDQSISKFNLDLNDNQDYGDHKDQILSVDEISLVAILTNRVDEEAIGTVYISDNPNLNTITDITDETKATRIFTSPPVEGNGEVIVNWSDGFAHMSNTDVLIDQILGDGMFTVYGIAENTPFDLFIEAEVVITVTVSE
jgi:hypothetical protein